MNITNDKELFGRFDLNLCRVFALIYQERNLTRVAERLCVSQSAVSHSLARMRDLLGDPLFVREAQGVIPSQLAEKMWPNIEQGLRAIQIAMNTNQEFHPRDINQLVLAIHDEVEPALLPALSMKLSEENLNITISSTKVDRSSLQSNLASGRLDCAIDIAHAASEQLHHTLLTKDEFVVVTRTTQPIDLNRYLAADHITVSSRRTGYSFEDWELARQGIHRNIRARCQNYQTAWHLVSQSDAFLTIPKRLAKTASGYAQNHIHTLPVDIPPIELHLYWHKDRESLPANKWMRNTLLNLV